jgi:peptide/nickel transport system ATP-binding protein
VGVGGQGSGARGRGSEKVAGVGFRIPDLWVRGPGAGPRPIGVTPTPDPRPLTPVLEVRNLHVAYPTERGDVNAVHDVSFGIARGEYFGLVGESGCGKSTIARAIMRLLPDGTRVAGQVLFHGRDVLQMPRAELQAVRWAGISLITQSSMNSLDPVYRVGDQLVEAIRAHQAVRRADALEQAKQLLELVGMASSRLDAYPHQLSGGTKQRLVIAMSLALNPALIIADEPTTALDVILQDQILARIKRLSRELGKSMLLITHDVSLIAENCDRMGVMYAGQIVEAGPVREVFEQAAHPYTMGLRNAFPSVRGPQRELISMPGSPPLLLGALSGCRFADRCPFQTQECLSVEPGLELIGPRHASRCLRAEHATAFREQAAHRATWLVDEPPQHPAPPEPDSEMPVVRVLDLQTHFAVHMGVLTALVRRGPRQMIRAVDGVSLQVAPRQVLGLAGESGCGKTTLGLTLVRLCDPTSGSILFDGADIAPLHGAGLKRFRRDVQMIFQDPYVSLNPRMTVGDAILEPLVIHGIGTSSSRRSKLEDALRAVKLTPPEEYMGRYPHELSGGQRQRVAIARAIVLGPRFVVADEPVSMLDASVRASVLELLRELTDSLGLAMLYISHDISTIRYICDRVAVMYLGRIVEYGPTDAVLSAPRHPYTRALMAAVPDPDPAVRRPRVDLVGDIPSPLDIPSGCRFRTRCPHAMPVCSGEPPALVEVGPSHFAACYLS